MSSLAGKALVVTGSGRGIGAACARFAAAQGASIVVNDLDAPAAAATVAAIEASGGTAIAHVGDISSWQVAEELVDLCVRRFGGIAGLVNNAALFRMALPAEETEQEFRRIVEVNVLGSAYCCIHAIRQMSRQGSGSIVNITSGAHAGIALQASYGATKGAVASMTYAWAADLAGSGIRINAVSPMADSRMVEITQKYLSARGKPVWPKPTAVPEDNAPVICYLLSDMAADVHGQIVRIEGKRVSLMTHPAVLHPAITLQTGTLDEVADVFERELKQRQLPLGVVALEAAVRPYALNYPVLPDSQTKPAP
jgi:NAD(P)-dependent dehydrogenase (short-subunit alcohol dehydrogenase family)